VNKKPIKLIPKIERPREKLVKYGVSKLSNSELLALILGTGTKNENVLFLSQRILKKYKTKDLPKAKLNDLIKIKGLGPAKACKIIAMFELSKRLLKNKKSTIYLTPEDIFNELKDIRKNKKEHFICFYLNARNQEIKKEIISIGTLTTSVVHPREVFENAIKNNAAQIVLAHNHPSNIVTPSPEDKIVTRRLKKAGDLLGIEVMDHVIVSKTKYFSMREKGLLEV